MINTGTNNNKTMPSDPAFKSAGIKPGLQIWRIENFALKPLPEKDHGVFYDGDSYVALKTNGRQAPFSFNIHFWLGKNTSKDEAGTAAMKSVELDDYLGGSPVQYREIQQHESKEFLSYFKKLEYRDGGVATGFKHVGNETQKRLLQIKGKKRPRVFEVPVECESLNRGDVFILDNGTKVWVWCGYESNKLERIRGMEFANEIRDSMRGGRAHVYLVEDDPTLKFTKAGKDHPMNKFFTDLGSAAGAVKAADEGGSDEKVERAQLAKIALYRVSNASGQIKVEQVGAGMLKHELLDSNDAFILDQGGIHIFVWIGSKADKDEKLNAMKIAVNFLRTNGYPDWTPVTRVTEKAEPPVFKSLFTNWPRSIMTGTNKTYSAGRGIASVEERKFDAQQMHVKRKREEEKLFDDGSGVAEVWRVEDFELVPQSSDMLGIFFGGDSYVILYTYKKNSKENYVVYYWLGHSSTQDEQGAAALHAVGIDDKLGGAAVQVRLVQGKETEHFMRIFKGRMVIYKGGKASGFRGAGTEIEKGGSARLFQIKCKTAVSRKAIEVDPVGSSLNSNDVFVLCNAKVGFLWYGKGCSGDERELAKEVAGIVSPKFKDDFTIVMEGKEPDDFWNILGGKTEYATGGRLVFEETDYPPRLFHCSNATGRFEVEEIHNFTQEDLEEDDIMILDCYEQVFVWVGKDSNQKEKKEAFTFAKEYVQTDPSGRKVDETDLLVVKQGYEPAMFTGYFDFWDPSKLSGANKKNYDEMKKGFELQNEGISLVEEELRNFSFDKKYSYENLKVDVENLPPGVDPTQKEFYLSPEDFKKVFGMTVTEYEKLPQWKRSNLKRKVDLY
ncbi:villin-1-like isoform X2 [Rhopilema esculentum]|uniref:villin-1-like isoform X2 n=1 Tax=Rhopilema esculentum TaxID=499914 RepID=UPI0031CE62B7